MVSTSFLLKNDRVQQAIQAEQEAYREAVKYTEGTAKRLPCSSCVPVSQRLATAAISKVSSTYDIT